MVAFVSDRKCSCLPCSSASASGLCLCCPPCWLQALLSLAQPVSDFRHLCSGQDLSSVFWCIKYLFPVSFLSLSLTSCTEVSFTLCGEVAQKEWFFHIFLLSSPLDISTIPCSFLGKWWQHQALLSVPLYDAKGQTGALSLGLALYTASLVWGSGTLAGSSWNLKNNQKIAFCLCLYISLFMASVKYHIYLFLLFHSLRITSFSSRALWCSNNDACFKSFSFSRYTCWTLLLCLLPLSWEISYAKRQRTPDTVNTGRYCFFCFHFGDFFPCKFPC